MEAGLDTFERTYCPTPACSPFLGIRTIEYVAKASFILTEAIPATQEAISVGSMKRTQQNDGKAIGKRTREHLRAT